MANCVDTTPGVGDKDGEATFEEVNGIEAQDGKGLGEANSGETVGIGEPVLIETASHNREGEDC